MTDKAHARFSASAAERWINCPVSVPLSDGIPNVSGPAAKEGTLAHDVAEAMAVANFGLGRPRDYPIGRTDEMLKGASIYVETISGYRGLGDRIELEVLSPALVELDSELGGTTDCRIYKPASRKIVVIDYKYGFDPVEAIGNRQMLTYALGALLDAPTDEPYDEIEMCIVQPRAFHSDGAVRRWCVTVMEVLRHLDDVQTAIAEARANRLKPKPGKHCKFCLAKLSRCEAFSAAAEFGAVEISHFEDKKLHCEPTEGELAEWLDKADLAEMWIKAVRTEADNRAALGKKIPGYKTVAVQGKRKWKDEAAALTLLMKNFKGDADAWQNKKLRSITEVQQQIGKPQMKMLAEVISTEPAGRGWNLVPVTDKGDEIAVGPQADFS